MPQSLVMAVGTGVGFFIAFVGLCELSFPHVSNTPADVKKRRPDWESSGATPPHLWVWVVVKLNVSRRTLYSTHS